MNRKVAIRPAQSFCIFPSFHDHYVERHFRGSCDGPAVLIQGRTLHLLRDGQTSRQKDDGQNNEGRPSRSRKGARTQRNSPVGRHCDYDFDGNSLLEMA
jgi:hypothetical protein